jgi:hypothetical protein
LLSDHERRVLDELERHYATEAPDPQLPGHRRRTLRALVITACLSVVALVGTGAALAGSAIALAAGLAWLLLHFWRQLTDAAAGPSDVDVAHAESGEQHRVKGMREQQ